MARILCGSLSEADRGLDRVGGVWWGNFTIFTGRLVMIMKPRALLHFICVLQTVLTLAATISNSVTGPINCLRRRVPPEVTSKVVQTKI